MPSEMEVPTGLVDGPAVPDRDSVGQEKLIELAESIKTRGLLNRIGLRRKADRFEIIWGARRWMAMLLLGWDKLPASVFEESEASVEEMRYVENSQREDLAPFEDAKALRRLLEKHCGRVSVVAALVGRSESFVRSRVAILEWPLDLREAVQSRRLSPSVAAPLVEVADDIERRRLIAYAVENGATAATTRYWAAQWVSTQAMVDLSVAPPPLVGGFGPVAIVLYPCSFCQEASDASKHRILRACPSCVAIVEGGQPVASAAV